ncbi:MAG: SRPBCC family protein [Chitinophagales bacterium]
MRIIRLIIISILVLFTIITIISLFIPSHIRISKAVQINSSKEAVMEQISDPGKWRNWYPDAHSSEYFYEKDSIKGLILDQDKKQFLVITGKKEDEVTAVYMLPNKKTPTGWQIISSQNSNSVTVQWYIDFHLRWYPWEKFASFMFEKVYNPQLKQGLDSLKAFVEK